MIFKNIILGNESKKYRVFLRSHYFNATAAIKQHITFNYIKVTEC